MNASRTLRGLAAGLLGVAVATTAMAQETVRVGVLLSYSGISGMAGQAADNLIKQFQKTHGSEPGGKKLEFIRRDTTGPNPEVARRMAQELIVREKAQVIIGPDFTPNVLAMAPLLTEAKVPAIIMGAATQGIVGEKSPYYTRTFYSIPQSVRPAAQWAAKNGLKKMVVVIADYAPGHDAEATFTTTFKELGGQVVTTIKVPVRNPEFSGYMQRIKDANADAVFAFMPIGELSLGFLKAYSDAGLKNGKLKLVTTGDVTDESTLDAAGDSALGVISTGMYSEVHDSALNKKFVADYQKAFGKKPRISLGNVAVWDALTVLYSGLEAQRGQKFDAEKFMATVKGSKFESPRGPFTLDKTTGDIVQNVYVRRVERRDGELQNVEIETMPDVSPK
ncbi:ABC transporter substrate-binding protein [Ramlibacter ginsenosidimutans]|uniref:ABC transporter substrate-binding protein n=1 Tax=Ramlibacter ginsenosidimutans TaxID=502333 RepID=A0A934TP07_9BURK|nr:ABC transporter substrate-binding protein [Ramlibacter ginsenosidimutans]